MSSPEVTKDVCRPRACGILRVVGDDRSGTTLIGTIIGQLPSAYFVGELTQIWRALASPNWRCSCGSIFRECEFWHQVLVRSGVENDFDIDLLRRITEQHLRIRPSTFHTLGRRALNPPLSTYAEALDAVSDAIADVSGCSVIIDSTKSAPELLLALRALRREIHVLHVIRDPRAVAYSRLCRRPASGAPRSQWRWSEGPIVCSARWIIRNTLLEIIAATLAAYSTRIRYEDFLARPVAMIAQIVNALRLPVGDAQIDVLPSIFQSLAGPEPGMFVRTQHAIAGNSRMLSQNGHIALRTDNEWMHSTARRHKYTIAAVSLPLMFRYHYLS